MLVVAPADARRVVPRALVMCACICCSLVLGSLGLFALDQANGASKHQVASLGSAPTQAAPTPVTVTTTTPADPGQPRRFIDGAAGVLTAPFRPIVHSSSAWGSRIAYTILAVIVYGFGLGYVARWARTY